MSTFKQIIDSVEENNDMNPDNSWTNWYDALDVLTVYGPYEDEDIPEDNALEIIDRAIKTDGASLVEDLAQLELDIWGQNFAGSWFDRKQVEAL